MAISFNRYIDITSGVGAGANVAQRDLVGRLFTDNVLLPPGTFLSFTSAAEVSSYFGSASNEYLRAVPYFAWVSKSITRAQSIQYARWVDSAVAPMIFGLKVQSLATYTAISNGTFGLTIGGVTNNFSSVDFSVASSLADVAAVLQVVIRTGSGAQWTGADVTYNSTAGAFEFVGGSAVDATITVQEGSGGTPIAALIGWLPGATLINGNFTAGAIWAAGADVESITETLTNSATLSNNFGSFLFMPSLDIAQVTEAANWNNLQDIMFLYTVPVASANVASYFAALANIGGVSVTLSNTALEYPEQIPMMIEAATDYTQPNAVQNYMFQQFANVTPSVTDDATANTMDAANTNYYGSTQTAGQIISFYQRGILNGLPVDPLDQNTYVNEIWLKDAAGAAIMNLLLALPQLPANAQGRNQLLSTLQSVIGQALNNGVISVGKTLTSVQMVYITEITNDPNAWHQVQNNGFWVNVVIVPTGNPVQYIATYTLVYSKDDVIRKVTGSHVLI